jgi:virginiamycin B lyase
VCLGLVVALVGALRAGARASADGGADEGGEVLALAARLEHASADEALGLQERLREIDPAARRAAVPVLLERAKGASWDERAGRVRALGPVCDERCVPFLTEALSSPDWRVVRNAAEALGRIGAGARPALSALASIAGTHWYPRVRTAAAVSKSSIASAVPRASNRPTGLLKLLDSQCYVPHDAAWKVPDASPAAPADLGRSVRVFTIVPRRWGQVLVETTGTVSVLERSADGKTTSRPVFQLPGAPRAYRDMPGGDLGIATDDGTVLLGPKAEIAGFVCNDPDLDRGPALKPNPDWFRSFEIPTARSLPYALTVGPDGALWFVEGMANKVGRLTTTGAFTEYPIPASMGRPQSITAGSDGAFWFTERASNRIGRVTTDGEFKDYPLPVEKAFPQKITAGPDGALWFSAIRSIGRITTRGQVKMFPGPDGATPDNIVAGPDRAVWVTWIGKDGPRIGRVTTSAAFKTLELSFPHQSFSFAVGTDGAFWWGDTDSMRRLTTTGEVTVVPVPGLRAPASVVMTADGTLWITSWKGELVRLTAKGVVTRYDTSIFGSWGSMTIGPDGALWLTAGDRNRIVRFAQDRAAP